MAQSAMEEIIKNQSSIKITPYEQSLEALNRDSCINVANAFTKHKSGGNFVFISAAKTIAPMFVKYSEMK